jgi:hypothetical protein
MVSVVDTLQSKKSLSFREETKTMLKVESPEEIIKQ